MKRTMLAVACLLASTAFACDEGKSDGSATQAPASATPPPPPLPTVMPSAAPTATAASWTKKDAADCKPHPATVDFGDNAALEAEVRRKLGKSSGALTPGDLAKIKSINLSAAKVHQIDPCVFPMFTALKDLFLGPGEYDDLTPLQKLATLESLRLSLSQVKDLHAIEGLKRMDRLDISHTLVGDDQLKSVGSLTNVTELMLDEDSVTDLSPIANLKKLERLSVKKTGVKDLSPLSQLMTLKFLYIADTPVTDITPVQPLIAGGLKLIQN
jgi:internalin A